MIGQTLDRYRINSMLGEGGMGVVHKARNTHLGRDVAIKVLPPHQVADPERKHRFVQEAQAASALQRRPHDRLFARRLLGERPDARREFR
jgi:serine/threonine protein kinase